MKFLLILVLIISATLTASAQHKFGTTDGVDAVMMSGTQYRQFDESSSKYFWAVDLKIFTPAQKSSFQELVFNNDLLVACSTPDSNNFWYLSSFKANDKELVKIELEKLITKAKSLSSTSTDKYQ